MINKKKKFIYAVDIYDIVENYLPYTKSNSFSNNLNNKVQKYFCYDYFFNITFKAPIVVLDEYKLELLAAKNKLLYDLKRTEAVLNNLEALSKITNNFSDKNDLANEFIIENLEIILLLIIIDSKKDNVINEFLKLLKEKLSISGLFLDKNENSEIVTKVFADCTYSKNVVDVFEKYIELNKFKLLSTGKEKLQERHIFLENSFRDILAIDRVRVINNSNELCQSKYSIVYLSSAFKTTKIIEAFNNHYNEDYLYHRDIFQVFLFDRICKEFEKDLKKGIDILEKINGLRDKFDAKKLFEINKNFDEETNNSFEIIKKIFSYESNQIENHFLLGAFNQNYGGINKINKSSNLKNKKNENFLAILKAISSTIENHRTNIFDLSFRLSQMYQTAGVASGLNNITNYNPSFVSGLDIIKNCHQHLPTLIFYNNEINELLKTKLFEFINENIEIPSDENKKSIELFNGLISLLINNKIIHKQKIEKTVLFSFLNLITQSRNENKEVNKNNSLENHLIADLEQIRLTIILDSNELSSQEGENMRIKQNKVDPIEIEIVYILIWLYRRNNFAEKAIKLGEKVMKRQENFSDFRIHQGVALAKIDTFYKKNSSGEYLNFNEGILENAIFSIETTLTYFPQISSLELNSSLNSIIIKNYCAVLNSLTDLNIRKFKHFAKTSLK